MTQFYTFLQPFGAETKADKKTVFKNKGFIVPLVMIIISLLLLLVFYFLDFIINDAKISFNYKLSVQTYYLAEAGINDAMWKILNDPAWYSEFTTNPAWQATLGRTGVFAANDGYNVSIQNTDLARAEITATAYINQGSQASQRVIKSKVYKSLSEPATFQQGISVYTNDEIYLRESLTTVRNSSIYSHNNIRVHSFSTLNVDEDVMASSTIDKSITSTINADSLSSGNYPPPPEAIEMPQIDFDSEDPGSYYNRADQIYTPQEFSDLCDQQECQLNGITYITGDIDFGKSTQLTINGVLVLDGDFKIGDNGTPSWLPGSALTVNKTPGQPAGILSKQSINLGIWLEEASINGLIYAAETFYVHNLFFEITVNSGIIANKLDINSLWQEANIILDQEVINDTLGIAAYSPLFNVEHWEEEY
ncbi:hypothetical protein KJ840_04165 [Patescibacteria group bacterium]|nr:hypothetical protein [Patescibacteria group bacterium]